MSVPTSNFGGNNQTSPPLSTISKPGQVAGGTVPGGTIGTSGSSNPYMPIGITPMSTTGATSTGTSSSSTGSLYDTTSSQSSGESDIEKQLIDIYGKGVGGSLNQLLQNMSGTDSSIYQQWLAGQQPVWAQQKADLLGTMGTAGASANSTVVAHGLADLSSQQGAQAAQENSSLMTQQLQDTIGILTGTEQSAQQEVASSGWDVFGQVMQALGNTAGTVVGAASGAGGFSELFS